MHCLVTLLVLMLCAICRSADVEECVRLCGELNRIRQGELEARTQWTEQRLALEGEIAAVKASVAKCQASLQAREQSVLSKRQELEAAQEKVAEVKRELSEMIPLLKGCEERLLARRIGLPRPLDEKLIPFWTRMKNEWSDPALVPERLSDLLSVYTEMLDAAQTVTPSKELFPDGSGGRRECNVLYLGLSAAYAISSDGKEARYGMPTPTGWVWIGSPDWATSIAKAIDVASGKCPATLVSLPMQIQKREAE